jgi:diguanylate cyclase (GGDEF)-like protein/PAS domain S-box-containing protein
VTSDALRFEPWDGDPDQALGLASLLRRIGGTAGVHIYELEVIPGGSYRCRVWIGQAVESLTGGIPDGMDAEDAWEACVHPEDRLAYDAAFERQSKGETTSLEYRMRGFDGVTRWVWERCTPRVDNAGTVLVDGVVADITERRRVEEQLADARDRLQQLAYHDPLTGLPNRLFFNERLEEALRSAGGVGVATRFAVLFVDLDRFKEVNDTSGHAVGDLVLFEVANRLRRVAGDALVARLGGDEFLLLEQPGRRDSDAAAQLAERIRAVLGWPHRLAGREFILGSSVGVAHYPHDGSSADELVRAADAAMYREKRDSRRAA